MRVPSVTGRGDYTLRAEIYLAFRARTRSKMPLFGKKDTNKKIKKDGKDDRSPSVEDKYVLKDLLGT